MTFVNSGTDVLRIETPENWIPKAVPVADWVTIEALKQNSDAVYTRLLRESPVAWVPAMNRVLFSSASVCIATERRDDVFSSEIGGSHTIRALGTRPLIRKDGGAHAEERKHINPSLRPKAMVEYWSKIFKRNAALSLEELRAVGAKDADLNADFAAPLAARNLSALIGLSDVSWRTIARWSRDFIAASGNVAEDADIWAQAEVSRAEASEVLSRAFERLRREPDQSITSLMLHAGMPETDVMANVLLAVSGGISEPQHVAAGSVYYLDRFPAARAAIDSDPGLWPALFDESMRYLTPIAALSRHATVDVVVAGYMIPADTPVGLLLAAANKDPEFVENPDDFLLHRKGRTHIAFGTGPHQCAGRWAAKASIGEIAVPLLYRELPNFRVDHSRSSVWDEGFIFRGLSNLPVTWG